MWKQAHAAGALNLSECYFVTVFQDLPLRIAVKTLFHALQTTAATEDASKEPTDTFVSVIQVSPELTVKSTSMNVHQIHV